MKANEINKLKKHAVIPAVFILIAIAFQFFYVDSKIDEYDSDASSIDSSLKSSRTLIKSKKSIAAQKDRFAKYKNYLTDFEKLIPEKKQLPDIIDKISDLAATDEVEIYDVRYMNAEADNNFFASSVRFDMKIGGKYASIVKFLSDVETMGYVAFNEEIQMNEGSTAYSVKIRIVTK